MVVEFMISMGRPDSSMSSNESIVVSYRIGISDDSSIDLYANVSRLPRKIHLRIIACRVPYPGL